MSGQEANTAMMVAHGTGALIAFNSSGGAEEWIMVMPIGTARDSASRLGGDEVDISGLQMQINC